MTLEALVRSYRQRQLTQGELFAAITALLSAQPENLPVVRALLHFDGGPREAFEVWLEDLKGYPVVALGDRHVEVSRALVAALGPPAAPHHDTTRAQGALVTIAVVEFTVPLRERPAGTFSAQIKNVADKAVPYGQWRAVVQPLADVESDDGRQRTVAVISLVSPAAPAEILHDGPIELFQGTTRIASASVSALRLEPPKENRRFDHDFLAEATS